MRLLFKTLGFFCAICVTQSASATLVDWSALNWPAGSLSNSYDVDPSNPGNDVTVTVSGDTSQLKSEPPQTPAITTNLQGGLASPASTLTLLLDLSSQSQSVTMTVNFSALYAQGVTNVRLQLFDVDFASSPGNSGANFQDQIRSISALSIDGTTLIAPTITISPNNSLSGSGLNQIVNGITTTNDTGAGSGAANVTIDFGSAAIQSFTLTYGSGSNTNSDPTLQHIGIYNIDYEVVPEPGALGACLIIVGLAVFQSHRWSKSRPSGLGT
jgi:hypothetical protein